MTLIPSAFNFIHQESVQFNNPTSESSLTSMGGSINGLLSILMPVGTIVASMLSETDFQTQIGNTTAPYIWVLADGRDVSGSSYATVTGSSTIPDLRGIFIRGKNNGRPSQGNPAGEVALGTYENDTLASHAHTIYDPGHSHTRAQGGFGGDNRTTEPAYGSNGSGSFGAPSTSTEVTNVGVLNTGGLETRPSNVTVNYMIRIN